MARVRLIFKGIAEIVGADGLAVITLTDESQQRAINVVCDSNMKYQLTLRMGHQDLCKYLLPEVLMTMLADYMSEGNLEISIYDINDGQYKTSLLNVDTYTLRQIRFSDAVLLHLIAHIPIYISSSLMDKQSMPFQENAMGISLPINTLDSERLKLELDKAVEQENYRLASFIKEELTKREGKENQKE